MTKLSVNINKIATLRNARGENNPDLIGMAKLIIALGAHGITVHPRPDERHIRKQDVYALRQALPDTELNIEGYPSDEFIALIHEIKPAQVTLVPDPPHVLTSNAGFLLREDFSLVQNSINKIISCGARVSIFIDPEDFINRDITCIKKTGTDRIELYTASFAADYNNNITLQKYINFSLRARELGIELNAGHDLSLDNLNILLKAIPDIQEVSIGHALICDALLLGMPETIRRYLTICNQRDN
jgi:pyridoxine 5-phosphate synthase